MSSLKQKRIFEAGTSNPSRLSLKVRDTDRGVNYEEPPATGNYAIHETSNLTFTNRIVTGSVDTPVYTITGR